MTVENHRDVFGIWNEEHWAQHGALRDAAGDWYRSWHHTIDTEGLKAEGWAGRDGWLSDLDSCPWEDSHRSSVCTNQARWRATSLTSRKTLQLCHAATSVFDKRPLNECLSVYESVPIQLARRRFPGPAISNAKIYISNKIYESNFIKQHSDTVTVWNYQNADYSLKKNKFTVHLLLFLAHFCSLERFADLFGTSLEWVDVTQPPTDTKLPHLRPRRRAFVHARQRVEQLILQTVRVNLFQYLTETGEFFSHTLRKV